MKPATLTLFAREGCSWTDADAGRLTTVFGDAGIPVVVMRSNSKPREMAIMGPPAVLEAIGDMLASEAGMAGSTP